MVFGGHKPKKKTPQKHDDSFSAAVHFSAQQEYHWVSEATQRLLSFSGRHQQRDILAASRWVHIDAWPDIKKRLFDTEDAPLAAIIKQQVDSKVILLDVPVLLNRQDMVWTFEVPVMLVLYTTPQPSKEVWRVRLSVLVDPKKDTPFLVTAASWKVAASSS